MAFLKHIVSRAHLGIVGEDTRLNDRNGIPLYIGDLVKVMFKGEYITNCITFIVRSNDCIFPWGLGGACDGESMLNGWSIELYVPHTNLIKYTCKGVCIEGYIDLVARYNTMIHGRANTGGY